MHASLFMANTIPHWTYVETSYLNKTPYLPLHPQHLQTALKAVGKYDTVNFTPNGVAGIFALYAPAGAKLNETFMNEFFVVNLADPL